MWKNIFVNEKENTTLFVFTFANISLFIPKTIVCILFPTWRYKKKKKALNFFLFLKLYAPRNTFFERKMEHLFYIALSLPFRTMVFILYANFDPWTKDLKINCLLWVVVVAKKFLFCEYLFNTFRIVGKQWKNITARLNIKPTWLYNKKQDTQ